MHHLADEALTYTVPLDRYSRVAWRGFRAPQISMLSHPAALSRILRQLLRQSAARDALRREYGMKNQDRKALQYKVLKFISKKQLRAAQRLP